MHGIPDNLVSTARKCYLAMVPDIADILERMYAGSATPPGDKEKGDDEHYPRTNRTEVEPRRGSCKLEDG